MLGEVDFNDVVTSVPDDLYVRHQVGDGSDVRTFPVDIQQLTRPMALLRLVRAFNANKFADIPLFVKTHNPNMVSNGIELLPASLTKATIYIVRDPRDVAVSFAKHIGRSVDDAIKAMSNRYNVLTDETNTSSRVSDLLSSWDQHVNSYRSDDAHNVLFVKYEEMRDKPEKAFGAILDHAGLPKDNERIHKALELTELSRLRDMEKEKGFRESSRHAKDQFFGEGKGKHLLTKAQKVKIENKFGRQMKAMGYL